jgi:glycosyltransferase involved in cell wall biosynthesis
MLPAGNNALKSGLISHRIPAGRMKKTKLNIAYLNINRFNPALCDGVSASSLELLQFLMEQGHEAAILTYCTHEPQIKNIFNQTALLHNSELKDQSLKAFSYKINGVQVYEELFPFNQTELAENRNHVLKSMNNKIAEAGINYLITVEDDFLSLLPGLTLGIPGAHFFHSPSYLAPHRHAPVFLKFLEKRNLFAVSRFLQAKIKSELGLDADLWHPLFDLGKYRLKKKQSNKNTAGYYSAGRHKGDEIFNRLVSDIPGWNFTVTGRHYTHDFSKIPENLKLRGDNPDFKQFYDSIGLLLVPSLTAEGFPRVILEAAVNGVPAIANSLGGIPEALGGCGIPVELDTTELKHVNINKLIAIYRKAIEHINDDQDFYLELRQGAINRARAYEKEQAELSAKNLKTMFES